MLHIGTREYWGTKTSVGLSIPDRRFHTYIIGKTGSGKTTLLRNLLIQEIEAGHGVGILDPHGDLAVELLDLIPRRINDVIYFNPADRSFSNSLNILQSTLSPELIASSIVGALKHVWHDSWGPRLEYILFASVASLAHCQNTSFIGINRLLTDDDYRQWVVRQVKDPLLQLFWEREFGAYNAKFMMETVSPILNKVGQVLMSPALRNILGQTKSKINIRTVLDRKQIFIANLSKGALGEDKSNLLGSFLVSQFELAALSRADVPESARTPYSLLVDEFQNFSTESFANILSESRKYGLQLTLSHQYIDQLNESVRNAVFGNVGSILAFRVGHRDAEILERELGYQVPASRFAELRNHSLIAKLVENGEATVPFLLETYPPLGKHYGKSALIKSHSQGRFCVERSIVEDRLKRWLEDY